MWKHAKQIFRKRIHRSSRGATLVEVVIAIVVLGLMTSSVPPVLIMLNHSQFKWNEQAVAESLVRTQFEYIKGCPYICANVNNSILEGGITVLDPLYSYETVPVPDSSYEIKLIVKPMQIDGSTDPPGHLYLSEGAYQYECDGDGKFLKDAEGRLLGIQEITIEVYHVDKLVISAKNYKVNR